MEGKGIELMSARELKDYITRKGFSHSDCCEKSELRQRALEASDRGVVEALLQDESLIADGSHWLVDTLQGILDEPCGAYPSGDNRNAFHLRKRLEGFRTCYPGVALDTWIDSLLGFKELVAFARSPFADLP